MLSADEYKRILAEHGRRVANRVAYASMGRGEDAATVGDFYAMYAPEDGLPEHEKCRTALIDQFDPIGFRWLYEDERRAARNIKYWAKWLLDSTDYGIRFVAAFVLTMDELQRADALVWLHSQPGCEEAAMELNDLTPEDFRVLSRLLTGKWPSQAIASTDSLYPTPGTPEAEEFIKGRKA